MGAGLAARKLLPPTVLHASECSLGYDRTVPVRIPGYSINGSKKKNVGEATHALHPFWLL